jgi:hypothetical protein
MHTLKGKLQTLSLSNDPTKGRKYINTNTNFGIISQYCFLDTYNPETDTGEQRIAQDKHVSKLRNAITNDNYTPEAFNATVPDLSMVDIDDKGNVTITLSEENKLPILNGGSRTKALETIFLEGGKTARVINDIPIPLIIQLNPEYRKQDFLNLNAGMKVNKSLIQSLEIASGRITGDKFPIFEKAKNIAKLLNANNTSPLHNKISFGETYTSHSLQASQLWTDHKASMVASLFGTSRILNVIEKDNEYFVDLFQRIYRLVGDNTDFIKAGSLLALPPDGAKGNVANWISIVNTVMYYLYFREECGQTGNCDDHILSCMKLYNETVSGDVSRIRRVRLSGGFAQKLFAPLETDPASPSGFHMGLPISFLQNTSESSLGVELLPGLHKIRKSRKKKSEHSENEPVSETKIDSDTDPKWTD